MRRGARLRALVSYCPDRGDGYHFGMTWMHIACMLNIDGRSRIATVIFQKPRMPISTMRRLSIEIALHQRPDLGFGLR